MNTRPMKSLFIVAKPPRANKAGRMSVSLRARNKDVAEQLVLMAQGANGSPRGYKFVSHSIRSKNSTSGGSNGKRRNVRLDFSQTDSAPLMPVPAARAFFAPFWEASLGQPEVLPNDPLVPLPRTGGSDPVDSSPKPRSEGES
jgi:hypothetical protein